MASFIDYSKPALILVNGKQGSGKSYLLKYMMREISLSEFPFAYGIVFSNTLWDGGFDYIPKKYQFEEWDEEILKNLMEIQRKNKHKRAFVIFDDCLFDPGQFTNPTIKKLCTQLRHYNITAFLLTQYCHLLPPYIRSNAMYSLIFDIGQGRRELESVYDSYGQKFDSYREWKRFYYDNTGEHKFILFNKHVGKFIIYKAPEHIPGFMIEYDKKSQ